MDAMIDVREAVRIARKTMLDIYHEDQIPQLTLEEAERSKDGAHWLITVSFARPFAKSAIEAMTGQQGTTTYKVVDIDAETGTVSSIRMRQV